jgi:hypothetical protein
MPIDNQTPAAATSGDLWTRIGAAAAMVIGAGGVFVSWAKSSIAKSNPPHVCQPVNLAEALKPFSDEMEAFRESMRRELHQMRTVELEPLRRKVNELDGRTAGDRSEVIGRLDRIEQVIDNLSGWIKRRLAPRDTTLPDRFPE